jgi:outer membrane protein OmpA-like peptidoglycan-associated protein
MTWSKRTLPLLVAALPFAAPAFAQVGGTPIELSAGAGVFKYDVRAFMDRGFATTGALAWRLQPWFALEGNVTFGPAKQDTAPLLDHNFSYAGLDMRFNLRPPESRAVPFLLAGAGYGMSHTLGHPPDKLERGAASVGLGVLVHALHPRTYLRVQVRDVLFRERDAKEFSNHLAATAGVHYVFLGQFRDQDRDGVRDWLDRCPNTPIGATVDAHGCPSDPDQDSVAAGIDKCPDTPRGCTVDPNGCPIDSDGDGVCDGVDTCADTPRGCTVSATGCPSDEDGDAVCDGVDKCPGTVKGCLVDSAGCTQDVDGDGVCDALDQCANTPAGTAVGATGCPTAIGDLERTLLTSGIVRVRGVAFDLDNQGIEERSHARLDSLGAVLVQYPDLKIEIGGPTDVTGDAAVKERLSLDQARAVYEYLKGKFDALNGANFTFRGYAGPAPAVPEAQRLRGRRIELKVLNPEALEAERTKRGVTP